MCVVRHVNHLGQRRRPRRAIAGAGAAASERSAERCGRGVREGEEMRGERGRRTSGVCRDRYDPDAFAGRHMARRRREVREGGGVRQALTPGGALPGIRVRMVARMIAVRSVAAPLGHGAGPRRAGSGGSGPEGPDQEQCQDCPDHATCHDGSSCLRVRPYASALGLDSGQVGTGWPAPRSFYRQNEPEGGALAGCGLRSDPPTMHLDELLGQGESESGALCLPAR